MVHDLPAVGNNLQDHLQARILLRCKQKVTWNDQYHTLFGRIGMGLRYLLRRKGPLTVSAGYASSFFKTRPELASPDIQVHFLVFSTDKMGTSLHRFPGFTASVCQLRPESRGTIHIKSGDPFAAPAIRANYLSEEIDQRTMVDGLKVLRTILEAPALEAYREAELDPGPDVRSDADLLDFCRRKATTIYHPSSTCAMGEVVTPDLKVIGLDRLRVVDASVMPRLVSGNCNAAIIMIGEKASDMILAEASGG